MQGLSRRNIEIPDKSEFMRIDPALIKIEAGSLRREESPQDFEALKASIAWRERRMKGSGLLVPLLVSKMPDISYYQLEDGFRRFKVIQSLINEGLTIDSIPVRILPSPLTLSERLMMMLHGAKPLSLMDEAKLIVKLEKQGLSLESMAHLMNRSLETLQKRSILARLTGPLAEALRQGTLAPEEVEKHLQATEELSAQQVRLEQLFKLHGKKLPTKASSVTKAPMTTDSDTKGTKSAWMPKILEPSMQYVAIEGLYEWMGGEQAERQGYSKKVVDIVKLMLKYCGGKMNLAEIAEKLKKH